MRVRTVGVDFPEGVLHGTTMKSAKAFLGGYELPDNQRQHTVSEWGSNVIYTSEWEMPQQARMFGIHGGTGYGGRVMLELHLRPGAQVADVADEIVRRGGFGNNMVPLHFCCRPSWTEDMAVWLNEARVGNGREPYPEEKALATVDPTAGEQFASCSYMPMFTSYIRSRGFDAFRLTDETIILHPEVVVGGRKLKKKEVEELQCLPRRLPAHEASSLFTEDCETWE